MNYSPNDIKSQDQQSHNGLLLSIIVPVYNVEKYLKESNNFDEFELEFFIFKITQLYQYIISSKDEKYFLFGIA